MSDPLDDVGRLAVLARQEQKPLGDVSDEVLNRIRRGYVAPPLPLARFAAVSAFAAAVCLACSSIYVSARTDPLALFFEMANAVLP